MLPPLHATLVCAEAVAAKAAAGWVMVTDAVAVFPLASVTVTVYEPAVRLVAVAAVPPEGDHKYEYGVTPPVAFVIADPLVPPKQLTLPELLAAATNNAGWVTVVCAVVVQPLASVTVTV